MRNIKKHLNIIKNKKGFTLIELLTVVAIIAILSVIAATIFANTQKNARDGRRRADVDAIAKALEVNRDTSTNQYKAISGAKFAGGIMPGGTATAAKDPDGLYYCAYTAGAVITTDPAAAGWGTAASPLCPAIAGTTPGQVTSTHPADNVAFWKICTLLENPVSVFCRSNAQ